MIDFFTNFGSLHRPGGHPPHAQRARPRGKTSQTPSEGRQVVSHLGEDGGIIAARSSDRLYLGVDHRGKLELFCGDIHWKAMDFRGPGDAESTVLDSLAIRTTGLRRPLKASHESFKSMQAVRGPAAHRQV